MDISTLARIEADIGRLTLAEQTLLLERLAKLIRNSATASERSWEVQLAAMADDPQIQQEILGIGADFESASADGLAGH
ncbi:hypothetical protein L6Q96_08010 [Candidatus Binatia bacterium]|nr:hypothetical protein [Candidatus Binatia bacterium]